MVAAENSSTLTYKSGYLPRLNSRKIASMPCSNSFVTQIVDCLPVMPEIDLDYVEQSQ